MVYCKDCKFFGSSRLSRTRNGYPSLITTLEKCMSNPSIHKRSSYKCISYYKDYAKPSIKNQHNNCIEFKPTLLKIFSTFFNWLRGINAYKC